MNAFEALLNALPHPPAYRYDWAALKALPGLDALFSGMAGARQNPVWHGEGDVMAHTRLACEALAGLPAFRALAENQRNAVSLATLLHDIGKITCTRLADGAFIAPNHGPIGAQQARKLLWTEYGLCGKTERMQFREAVCLLIRYHTLPLRLFERGDGPAHALRIASNGELAPDFSLNALCLLAEADVRGHLCPDRQERLDRVELSRELAREAGCLMKPYPFASAKTARALFSGGSVWPDQALYDASWGEALLMCGLPGTGKDTWLKAQKPDLPQVCLDDWRKRLGIRPSGDQSRAVQAAREEARGYLRSHRPFVWNATSLTALRARQISQFEDYGARVRVVYLETDWEENLLRNALRADRVPEHVIARMLEKLEPPQRFDAQAVEWRAV
ncbi:MAG: AAA family ATPase [Clostridia bacterium]|nr:AAA family ATPase [Clostridia bacterium]